jgi:hypothetical protein
MLDAGDKDPAASPTLWLAPNTARWLNNHFSHHQNTIIDIWSLAPANSQCRANVSLRLRSFLLVVGCNAVYNLDSSNVYLLQGDSHAAEVMRDMS